MDFKDLKIVLSGIHTNDHNRHRAITVASHLVSSELGDEWNDLSDDQTDSMIESSAKRLWDNYMHCRKSLKMTNAEAAEQVIMEEIRGLKQLFHPNMRNSG